MLTYQIIRAKKRGKKGCRKRYKERVGAQLVDFI